MNLAITGRHINIGEAFQMHIREKFETVVKKYFGRTVDGAITISKDHNEIYADISVHPGKGLVIQAKAHEHDAYIAFDNALDKLDLRMRKYKARLRDHHKGPKESEILLGLQYVVQPQVEEENLGEAPAIIAEIEGQVPTLSVSEAVMALELSDESALLFKNVKHGGFNMVHRRSDGQIGWVDPEVMTKKTIKISA